MRTISVRAGNLAKAPGLGYFFRIDLFASFRSRPFVIPTGCIPHFGLSVSFLILLIIVSHPIPSVQYSTASVPHYAHPPSRISHPVYPISSITYLSPPNTTHRHLSLISIQHPYSYTYTVYIPGPTPPTEPPNHKSRPKPNRIPYACFEHCRP